MFVNISENTNSITETLIKKEDRGSILFYLIISLLFFGTLSRDFNVCSIFIARVLYFLVYYYIIVKKIEEVYKWNWYFIPSNQVQIFSTFLSEICSVLKMKGVV